MHGGSGQATATVKIGLLADPGLPMEIAQQLVEWLPETLSQRLPRRRRWSVAVATEELSEVDAPGDRLVERAAQRREEEGAGTTSCV